MTNSNDLKADLEKKIIAQFSDQKAFIDYILTTKKNFLYRYLETSTDKNIEVQFDGKSTFQAKSFEENMGEALKNSDPEIKSGVKFLAKSFPREDKPKLMNLFETIIQEISGEKGTILIKTQVNWGFPDYVENKERLKSKEIVFKFENAAQFRKELALKYEEACELFN